MPEQMQPLSPRMIALIDKIAEKEVVKYFQEKRAAMIKALANNVKAQLVDDEYQVQCAAEVMVVDVFRDAHSLPSELTQPLTLRKVETW